MSVLWFGDVCCATKDGFRLRLIVMIVRVDEVGVLGISHDVEEYL